MTALCDNSSSTQYEIKFVTTILIHLTDVHQVSGVSFDFAVVDSNSLMFVFHHAPDVAKELYGDKELSFDTVTQSDTQRWTVIS